MKALETWDDVETAVAAAGFEVRRVVYWNGVFQSFIDNVLLRLAERAAVTLRTVGPSATCRPPPSGEGSV